jgi:uncharacterized protein (TIGR02270 family)
VSTYPPDHCIAGFKPAEISAMVNIEVVEQHASEAAFLWKQREHAACAPQFKLKHIAKLDARLRGHLDGLRVAGEAGWHFAQRQLTDANPGTVFVAAFLASLRDAARRIRPVLAVALAREEFEWALCASLVWHDRPLVRSIIDRFAESSSSAYRRIALTTAAARRDPVARLEHAARDPDASLRVAALRNIGERLLRQQMPLAYEGARDENPECQFWAAWVLTLLGDPGGAHQLFDISESLSHHRGEAIETAVRCGDAGLARNILRKLASRGDRRHALRAAGALGDVATIPWIMDHFDDLQYARVAGEAFSMLTGADLEYLDLDRDPPEDAPPGEPEDGGLRWPDAARVRDWWQHNRARFAGGERYLCGLPLSKEACLSVLRDGYQRQRAAAAIQATCCGATVLFPVRAPSDEQRSYLVFA